MQCCHWRHLKPLCDTRRVTFWELPLGSGCSSRHGCWRVSRIRLSCAQEKAEAKKKRDEEDAIYKFCKIDGRLEPARHPRPAAAS